MPLSASGHLRSGGQSQGALARAAALFEGVRSCLSRKVVTRSVLGRVTPRNKGAKGLPRSWASRTLPP
jgi:hypothetical protein